MFKVNNKNNSTLLAVNYFPQKLQWPHFGILIVNFEHISHIFLAFLLFTLSINVCWLVNAYVF